MFRNYMEIERIIYLQLPQCQEAANWLHKQENEGQDGCTSYV